MAAQGRFLGAEVRRLRKEVETLRMKHEILESVGLLLAGSQPRGGIIAAENAHFPFAFG